VLLASSLLALELIGGIQSISLTAVIPAAVADLGATRWYGIVVAAPLAVMFLTLPAGAALVSKVRLDHLFWTLTLVSVGGSVLCAVAGGAEMLVAGRVIGGLAGGALASVSLSVVSIALPDRLRRVVLAGYSVVWVGAALLGPVYTAVVTGAWGWRWAFVAHLPLLVVARGIAARRLRSVPRASTPTRYRVGPAALLAIGVATLSLAASPASMPWSLVVGASAAAVVLVAATRLLPPGVLRARPGRPALFAVLGLVTAAYFGAQAALPVALHVLLGADVAQVAIVMAAGGLGWALAATWCGARPVDGAAYVRRSTVGALLLACGTASTAVTAVGTTSAPVALTIVAWGLAGAGTGLLYLDTLRRAVGTGRVDDELSAAEAATAASTVEAVATALAASTSAGIVGGALSAGTGGRATVMAVLTACALLAPLAALAARHVR
jgi:MFS family permease